METDWTTFTVPKVLWLNTGVLILASVAMQWTRDAANPGPDRRRTNRPRGQRRVHLRLSGRTALGLAAIQADAGYFVAVNPAFAFFYLLTALHAVHLLGGLVVWGRTTARVWRVVEVGDVRLSVELCTVYWHFLLAVWVVLFALLLHTHS